MLSPKARECDILSGFQHSLLVSVGKLSDAGYYTIFMPGNQGVQVVDGNNVKINVSGDAVLRGWRDPQGLWRVPMDDGKRVTLSQHQLGESIKMFLTCLLLHKLSDICMLVQDFPLGELGSRQSKKEILWDGQC